MEGQREREKEREKGREGLSRRERPTSAIMNPFAPRESFGFVSPVREESYN